ncbi:hypothetical protein [Rhodoglobus aureus]|uniref:hypothetical protein n=1 Tax=Rhodoglobus aureus TaxID=191497 RepID=UPI0031E1D702
MDGHPFLWTPAVAVTHRSDAFLFPSRSVNGFPLPGATFGVNHVGLHRNETSSARQRHEDQNCVALREFIRGYQTGEASGEAADLKAGSGGDQTG